MTKKRMGWILIVIGVVGASLSTVLYAQNTRSPETNAGSVNGEPAPSSVKLSRNTIASYSAPPKNPKYIQIPSLGIGNTPVVKLGLLSNGAIATPNNIYETGWYEQSALPGQPGAMFIYGHVSNWTANGIFYDLKKLVSGDKIIITTGNNTIYTYRVSSSKVYSYNSVDMHAVLSPVNAKVPGLNLMTCTGTVMKGTSEFNERLVVFTSLVVGSS